MNYIDIVFAIALIWFAYKGYNKGLIIEITSLAALITGIYAAWYFSDYTAGFLSERFNISNKYMTLISFSITFIGIVILVYFMGKLLERVVNLVMLGFVNKLFGAVFGLLKMAFILSVLLFVLNSISIQILPEEKQERSVLYKPVENLAPMVLPGLKELKDSLITR